jgi:hypothetical protein
MGDVDNTISNSFLRMNVGYEYSQYETRSNMVYSLVNSDEHDRLLVDPAYRLERTKKLEEVLEVYVMTLNELEEEYARNFGPLHKIPFSKVDYETMVDVELMIAKLDRNFRKVQKFEARMFLDQANHARREERMKLRARERWEGVYTFYHGDLTEEEQKYRDYFETDLEDQPENEALMDKLEFEEIMARPDYNLDRFDFQEMYTNNPEEDRSSLVERMVFRFRYRQAGVSFEEHIQRETKMQVKAIERLQKEENLKLQENYYLKMGDETVSKKERLDAERKYLLFTMEEGIRQFKDYFEGEQFTLLDSLPVEEKTQFSELFENYARMDTENKGYSTIPKRKWNEELGLAKNLAQELRDYTRLILPEARRLENEWSSASLVTFPKKEFDEIGYLKGLEEIASGQKVESLKK